ncbi:hypothetical protein ACFQAT_08505 [Undibacterium arcticum]|uniref:hypothetical protein n=1 Tax=Undibacterium arcticum TaxID=1762892 RepID=UPI00360C4938
MFRPSILWIVVFVAISGCTTQLKSDLIQPDSYLSSAATQRGLFYRLPAKQITVTVDFELTRCTAVPDLNNKSKIRLDAKVTATLAENIIGDNTQTYVLDYEALAATTKVTNMDIGVTDTGLLTGINSAVVDQTGNVIKDTATSVASIARAIVLPYSIPDMVPLDFRGTPPVPPKQTKKPKLSPPEDLCKTFNIVKNALDDAQKKYKADPKLDTARANLEMEITAAEALITQLKADAEFHSKFGTKALQKETLAEIEATNKLKHQKPPN